MNRGGGKAPRYGGKQPRRQEESDDDDEDVFNGQQSDEDSEGDWGGASKKTKSNTKAKAAATSKKGRGKKKKAAMSESEEDEDEGAASGNDDDDDDEDEEAVFDPEKLYTSAADRAELLAMNEFEREEMLADRHEARLREIRKRKNIKELRRKKQLALSATKKPTTLKRGKAAVAGKEDAKSARQRSSLEDMRRKKAKTQRADSDESGADTDQSEASGMSDSDDDEAAVRAQPSRKARAAAEAERGGSDSDSDDAQAARSSAAAATTAAKEKAARAMAAAAAEDAREEWPDEEHGGITVDDMNKIRVLRRFLEEKLEEPYLEKAIKGCFVRYLIGAYQGEAIYRVCEVREVVSAAKPYRLPGADKSSTLVMLKVRHGSHENVVRVDKVSNHRFTANEVNKWRTAMRDTRLPTLTPDECQRRHDKIVEVSSNHVYTTNEVQAMVKRRAKAAIASGGQNLASAQIKLTNEIMVQESNVTNIAERMERAAKKGLDDQMDSFEDELKAAEATLAELRADLDAVRNHHTTKVAVYSAADKLGQVNERNKTANTVIDGVDSRAILAEEFSGSHDAAADPFRRTRTKMQDLWSTTSERVDDAKEGKMHADIFSKLFGGPKEAVDDDAAAVAALKALQEATKSSTGLRRRHPDLPPRKRKGISLAEYLKQAQLQQETEGQ